MIARREGSRESFRQIYRAMLTAGAADRDSQVVAVVARVVRKPAGDEVIDVAVHTLDFRNGLEEFDDGGVFPCERPQRGAVYRSDSPLPVWQPVESYLFRIRPRVRRNPACHLL